MSLTMTTPVHSNQVATAAAPGAGARIASKTTITKKG